MMVYIILPVHNRRCVTAKFINSLNSQIYKNFHLLLIDDGSEDGTAEMVLNAIRNTTVITGKGDWWWAGSLQQGIDWLVRNKVNSNEIILFANDDIVLPPNFLQKAVELMGDVKSTLLLSQIKDCNHMLPKESGVELDFKKLTFNIAAEPNRINCLSTRGLFLRVSDVYQIGGFYPRVLPHYLSDYEFTIRAQRKGFNLSTSPELVITIDKTKTGYRDFERMDFITFLQQFFSKRSVSNPIYYSVFLILVSPLVYLPINLIRVWWAAARLIVRQAIKNKAVV